MLAAKVHPKVMQERRGHYSIAIAMDIYSQLMPNTQESTAAAVDDALRAALNKRRGRWVAQAVAELSLFSAQPEKKPAALTVGRVAEWFKAPVLKTGVPARVPWVRIPPLPPKLHCPALSN
jgi:hypothetical protein